MRKEWKEFEIQYLIENHSNKSIDEMCLYLERSYSSVAHKLCLLNLTLTNNLFWTEEKIDNIRLLVTEHKTHQEIADTLKASKNTISILCASHNITNCHGQTGTHLHNVWKGLNSRCSENQTITGKSYREYYSRGIRVCQEWKIFENFQTWALNNGYQEGLSIERIDVNGNYCPENCEWITKARQANNKRNTLYLTAWEERKSIIDWTTDIRCKTNYSCIVHRINEGKQNWTNEEILSTPSGTKLMCQ